jgi:transcriptional regulator with XRE-family HTH domain
MPPKSLRQERHDLTRRLRADGRTWVEISAELRTRWPDLTVLASLRLAHGWTQQEAANEWAHHWPEEAKTSKEIGLWENWRPTGTGRRPSLTTLDKLARVYQCSVADLLADVYDHRRLDPASTDAAPEPTGASADSPAQERLESITSELVATVLGSGRAGDQPAEGATPPALVLASRVQQVWRLRQLADYRSLGRILPGLVRDAEAAARVSSTDQEQAVHAAVHAYNAASSFLKTVGDCDDG